jgi:lysophospholipase L1-like esterase
VLIEITPTSSRWKQWNDIQKVNELLKEYCTTKEDLYFVETAAAFLNKEGKPKDELFISDRLHLNSEGYVLWNQLIKKRLITIKEKAIL